MVEQFNFPFRGKTLLKKELKMGTDLELGHLSQELRTD
jgi:hypothetical protein